jgi:hypothetical protein
MVIVSHDHGFVFLKTRKTAGTSVEMVLEPFCRPPGAEVSEKTPTLVSRHGIVGRRLTPRSRLERLLFRRDWYNHMTAAEVRAGLGPDRWARYRKVAALRNPFDLAVSRYHWELARHGLPEAEDFAETRGRFAEMVQSGRFDGDHGIVHLDGHFVADTVVRFETLAADVAALVQQLVPGAAAAPLPHTKKTANRRQHPVADYYDAASIAAIRKSSAWVFDRFGYPDRP